MMRHTPLQESSLASSSASRIMPNSSSHTLDSALDSSLHDPLKSSHDMLDIHDKTLLASFINECLEHTNSNPLKQLIAQIRYVLHRTNTLTAEQESALDDMLKTCDAPICIAVVGQFSSGKSSFLNAIIGRAILPSGITPITSKICHIRYGETYRLDVLYHDNRLETKPLEFFTHISEIENMQIKEFFLYAPSTLLRNLSLLDTPGFNSQNAIDTHTTNTMLKQVDGIIWLSLIDNVGKQSEMDIINAHIKQYVAKSLCVLNQKDRLSSNDIATSLEYANRVFHGCFSKIIAISAKDALQALASSSTTNSDATSSSPHPLYERSNIAKVLDFLHELAQQASSIKQRATHNKLKALLISASKQITQEQEQARNYLHALSTLDSTMRFQALQSGLEKQFLTLFTRYDNALDNLASYIFSTLESRPFSILLSHRNIFGIRTHSMQTHHATMLPKDTLLSHLTSEEHRHILEFRALGLQISAFATTLATFFSTIYEHVLALSLPKAHIWNDMRHHTSAHILLHNASALIALQGELDALKSTLTLSYHNAIALALTTLDNTIQYALTKHQSSPNEFALFTPTLENIRDALNSAFHFATFQEKLSLHNALYKKTLWSLSQDYRACTNKAQQLATPHMQMLDTHTNMLQEALKKLDT